MTKILRLLKDAFLEFWEDNALRMAATLAYYVLFALPPVIMILLSFITIVVPDKRAFTTLIKEISDVAGPTFAQAIYPYGSQIDSFISQSITARYTGIVLLILALYAVVSQCKYSLNRIWKIAARPKQPLFFHFRQRFVSLIFILIFGSIVIGTFIVHVGVNFLVFYASEYFVFSYTTIQWANAILAFVSVWILIATIYRWLPDGTMSWKDVFLGGFVTSILFVLGKYVIGSMLSHSVLISIYGVMGSVLILLLWIYYLCIIFFFGAEFTQVYANSHGSGISYDSRFTFSLRPYLTKKKVVN